MTTIIEIIDTAVKIGLGALVSGITTYAMTVRNHKHEIKKSICNDKKQLLLELTKRLDSGLSIRNSAIQSIWRKTVREDGNLEEDYKLLTESVNEIKLAVTYSYLIGNIEMAAHIRDIFTSLEIERKYLETGNRDLEFVESEASKRQSSLVEFRSMLTKALDAIYA